MTRTDGAGAGDPVAGLLGIMRDVRGVGLGMMQTMAGAAGADAPFRVPADGLSAMAWLGGADPMFTPSRDPLSLPPGTP